MTPETWLQIPGYEGSYEVSDRGNVRSLDREVDRWDSILDQAHKVRVKGRALKTGTLTSGYPCANLWSGSVLERAYVHRLVLAAFVGPCPKGQEVRHLDGDRLNSRLSNLAYGTREENLDDQARHGTTAVTPAKVREIRASSKSRRELAELYQVSRSTIARIVTGQSWRHVRQTC